MRFGFLVNEVVTGLRRNVTMTIAMILTTAISIGLFGGGLLVVQLAKQSRDIYLDRVESQVFLTPEVSVDDPTCDAEACKTLRGKIEARDDVKSVRFLNRDDAYTDAITKFPEYKDVASTKLLEKTRRMISSSGYTISNIDTVVIAEAPPIMPHRQAIFNVLSRHLGVSGNEINIKATTTEGMGITGKGEAIAAMATALIVEKPPIGHHSP